jgi:hypothetical protein
MSKALADSLDSRLSISNGNAVNKTDERMKIWKNWSDRLEELAPTIMQYNKQQNNEAPVEADSVTTSILSPSKLPSSALGPNARFTLVPFKDVFLQSEAISYVINSIVICPPTQNNNNDQVLLRLMSHGMIGDQKLHRKLLDFVYGLFFLEISVDKKIIRRLTRSFKVQT